MIQRPVCKRHAHAQTQGSPSEQHPWDHHVTQPDPPPSCHTPRAPTYECELPVRSVGTCADEPCSPESPWRCMAEQTSSRRASRGLLPPMLPKCSMWRMLACVCRRTIGRPKSTDTALARSAERAGRNASTTHRQRKNQAGVLPWPLPERGVGGFADGSGRSIQEGKSTAWRCATPAGAQLCDVTAQLRVGVGDGLPIPNERQSNLIRGKTQKESARLDRVLALLVARNEGFRRRLWGDRRRNPGSRRRAL